MEHIVGMMWNKNEGDLLTDTIASALENVDTLVIADDGSTDNSWDIIQGFAAHHKDQIEHIQRAPDKNDKAQRQALLNVIQQRYRPEDTWVQLIESDIMIMDTDIRLCLNDRANGKVSMRWRLLNATVPHEVEWMDVDTYPNWDKPIQEIMSHGHILETMTYTFRPFPEVTYTGQTRWRPWPDGLGKYPASPPQTLNDYKPLLAHYGYRGPVHFYKKFAKQGISWHPKYTSWDLTSPESVRKTVSFFNGEWNSHPFRMDRVSYSHRDKKAHGVG